MLFPVIHESECLRVYCTAKLEGSAAVSQSWLCLLNVIFALATYASTTPDQITGRNEHAAEEFIEKAETLSVHIAMKSADLEIVQCLLLIAQYYQGTQKPDKAWHLHGLAVRAATQLGLHSPHAYVDMEPLECELRKRTWFGCVILDRMLSMTLGRPYAISDELLKLDLPLDIGLDAVSRGPTPMTSDDQSAAPSTVCLFIATIQLYEVLGDIIKKLYGSNTDAGVQQTVPALLGTISQLEHKLEVWKQNLPPQLQQLPLEIQRTSPDLPTLAFAPVFDRLSIILALRYLNARILLHRPILSACLRQKHPFGPHKGPASEAHHSYLYEFANISVKICERSAVEVIDIVCKASRQAGTLGTWWFSAYYTYNAALVIFSCILLHTTTSRSGISTEKDEHHHANLGKIVHLQRAFEATGRLGAGSITAKKIQRALLTHRQTCMTLVQSDVGDGGKEDASGSSIAATGFEAHVPNIDAVPISNATGMISSEASNVPFLDLAQDGPFATLDEGVDQPWSDIDWLSHEFGPETQLDNYPRPSSNMQDLLPNGRFVACPSNDGPF
ncbi:Fungal specific transcription factor domain-containing protein [Cladophialophora immunda]|nr:Fungal specific transcription factor domain-containing protein [Cladophialophora immunda]